ncbi:hypothetical protein ACQP0C_11695 [Nocardia sp. CA-129566]|uniref:hypothetical protein n=1 Tax=Nocardia sp. CA-129566 TaxID=3239976 RepID=UPI003D9942B9
MPSAKTSTVLGLVRHATTLRLTRIATLVAGSLVFLYACEVSRKSDLSDVWPQVVIAAGLAMTGLITAWFEVRAADHAAIRARTDIRGFLIESDDISVRARITRSGDLVFHGHDSSGPHPAYEWDWAFRASTFPAIRAALGGKGDLLELLERTVPHWDRQDRYDPGAWLHNQGIPAAFRERGDSSSRTTRVLPVIKPEAELTHHDPDAPPSRASTGQQELTSSRRTTSPHRRTRSADQNRPEHSDRRRDPSPEQNAPAHARRRAPADQLRPTPSSDPRAEQPAAIRPTPGRRRDDSPRLRNTETSGGDWSETPDPHHRNTALRSRNETSGAHRHALSGANRPESPWPQTSESQSQRWTEPPERRRRG